MNERLSTPGPTAVPVRGNENEEHARKDTMKVLISDHLEQSCIDILTHDGMTVDNRPGLPASELQRVIGEYDALIVRSASKVSADVIAFRRPSEGDRTRRHGS